MGDWTSSLSPPALAANADFDFVGHGDKDKKKWWQVLHIGAAAESLDDES